MHGRVNTRLLVILAVVAVVVVGGLGTIWAVFINKTTAERIAIAREYRDSGDVKRAVEELRKAANKDQTNEALMVELHDTLALMQVASGAPARKIYEEMSALMTLAQVQAKEDPAIFQRRIDLLKQWADRLRDMSAWNAIYEVADTTLGVNANLPLAHKYRGMAQVNRLRVGLSLNEAERLTVKDDLESFLKIPGNEEDQEVIMHLATLSVVESEATSPRPTPQRIAELRAEAERLTAEALAAKPDDMRRQINHAAILLLLEKKEKARTLVTEMERQTLAEPGKLEHINTVMALIEAVEAPAPGKEWAVEARQQVNDRQRKLMAVASEKYPDDLAVKLQNALNFSRGDDEAVQKALTALGEIRALVVKATPVEAILQTHYQRMASRVEADLRLRQLARMEPDDPKRPDEIKQVQVLLKEVVDFFGEGDPQHRLLAGRLSLLENRYADAAVHLREANKAYQGRNPEVLVSLVQALVQLDQTGEAMNHVQTILEFKGLLDYTPFHALMADLAIQAKQFHTAEEQIKKLAAAKSDDPRIPELQMKLANAQGDMEKVLEMAEKFGGDRAIYIQTQVLANDGRRDEAVKLMEAHFAQHPEDMNALQMLLSLGGDNKDRQLAYVRQAQAAGVKNEAMDKLTQVLEGKITMEQFMEEQIQRMPNAVDRALMRYSLLAQSGKQAQAEEQLAKAEKEAPNDPRVINALFNLYLAKSNWQQAQGMIAKAKAQNLDHAEGLYYTGRMEMARRRYDRAVIAFRDAVKKFETSEGWQLLGEAQLQAADPEAIDSFEQAIELKPQNLGALRGLAAAYDRRNEHGQALAELAKAHQYDPKNVALRQLYLTYLQQYGDKDQALNMRQEIARTSPDDYDNRRGLALLLAELKRDDEARQTVIALIDEEGKTLSNVATLAELAHRQGDSDRAYAILKDYVSSRGEQATMEDWLALARLLFDAGRADESLDAYQQARKLEDPTTQFASRELGDRLFSLGATDPEKYRYANMIYEELLKSQPEDRGLMERSLEAVLALNETEKAETLLTKLKALGEDDQTWLLDAKVAVRKNDMERAMRALDRAGKLAPQQPIIPLFRAQILVATPGQEGAAMEAVNKALSLNANLIQSRLIKVTLLARNNEIELATEELRGILQINNEVREARLQLAMLLRAAGRNDDARRSLEESIALFPAEAVWRVQSARLARAEGRLTEAAESLEAAFKLKPTPDLLAELVVALVDAKRANRAVTVLQENKPMLEEQPVLYAYLGVALANDGQLDEARTAFLTALDRVKNYPQTQIVSAQVASGLGRSRAPAVLEEAIRPLNEIWVNMQLADWEVADHRFLAAAKRLKALDSKVAPDADERNTLDRLLSISLHQTKEYPGARQAYERMLKRDPNDIITLNNLAYLLSEEMNQPAEALPYAEKVYQLFPENDDILDTYGWILYRVSQRDQALLRLRRSVELRKTKSNCVHLVKVLLAREGDGVKDEARQLLLDAKRIAEQTRDEQVLTEVNSLLSQTEPLSQGQERE